MAKKYITDWSEVPIVVDIPYVSVLLGTTPETIRRYLRDGKIKGIKAGKGWVVRKSELMHYLGEPVEQEEKTA